jgi:hypothetical protein
MAAPEKLKELVEQYVAHRDAYRAPAYLETQARIELIDRLFELLGWDIKNERGFSEAYKDVVHEDRVRIEGKAKAPDYAFRIGGVRKFLLEAKKPSLHLSTDTAAALQVRRYAWSANLSLCVLTNFEELVIYDATVKPAHGDSARKARVKLFTYADYETNWGELVDLLSPAGIQKGNFDKFIAGSASRRGSTAVDVQFLAEIEGWRSALAADLARKNVGLAVRDLNFCVQAIIDRIVFLRIAEDRGIETYGRLKSVAAKAGVYPQLVEAFRAADRRYNSGLFHLIRSGADDTSVDVLTPMLTVSDSVLRPIINGLYFPDSPYEFSIIPADMLGRVYEQFLGKVITLKGRVATVEVKPEVKKSGGVFYTPAYVVKYLISSTVGSDLEKSSVTDISGEAKASDSPYRVIDPACGSGSFLIEVYQALLDWYLEKYTENTKRYSSGKRAAIYNAPGGWKLRISERKRILLDHIYGVDIDAQAVEVTKLSLLLKVLEGESSDDIAKQMDLFRERVLPDLGNNIRCGNSLIGPAYEELYPRDLMNPETRHSVNIFDWAAEFPAVFRAGGFDTVVGNPPYFSIDKTWGAGDHKINALKTLYPQIHTDKTDIYYYFIAKSLQICQGSVGFIVSRAFLEAVKAKKLRGFISQHSGVEEIFDFQNFPVFDGVGITTAMIVLSKHRRSVKTRVVKVNKTISPADRNLTYLSGSADLERFTVPRKSLGDAPWNLSPVKLTALYAQIDKAGEPLASILALGQGMQTGANGVFGKFSAAEVAKMGLPERMVRRRITNTDIQRFSLRDSGEYLLYLEEEKSFAGLPSALQEYLKKHRPKLEKRAAFVRGNCEWWRYTWPLQKDLYINDRIVCPYMAKDNRFAISSGSEVLGLTDTTVIFDGNQKEDIRYICALLNSQLLTLRYRGIGKLKSSGILEYFDSSVGRLPIRRINWTLPAEVKIHDAIVDLYDELADAHTKLQGSLAASVARVAREAIATSEATLLKTVCALYRVDLKDLKAIGND